MAASVTLLVALVGLLAYILRPLSTDAAPRFTHPVQITSAVGLESHPAWSPDGAQLAFHSAQSGNPDIWVVHLGGGPPVNRTADRLGRDRRPSWSPDASQIAFVSTRELFVMPAVGGTPRKLLSRCLLGGSTPQWSADGNEIALVSEDADDGRMFIEIVTLRTQETRRLPLPELCCDMSWSPDGRFCACIDGEWGWSISRLRIFPLSGGEAIPVTEGQTKTGPRPGRRTVGVSSSCPIVAGAWISGSSGSETTEGRLESRNP